MEGSTEVVGEKLAEPSIEHGRNKETAGVAQTVSILMNTFLRAVCYFLMAFQANVFAGLAFQQNIKPAPVITSPPPAVKFGSVTGRVSLGRAGDLKPARMARVYLLDKASARLFVIITVRLLQHTSDERVAQFKKNLDVSESYAAKADCRYDLLIADQAIEKTLDLAKERSYSVVVTDTDEEGNFEFQQVRAGADRLVVRGQAGANDALWEENISVTPDKAVSVKLSSVQQACSNIEAENP